MDSAIILICSLIGFAVLIIYFFMAINVSQLSKDVKSIKESMLSIEKHLTRLDEQIPDKPKVL